MCTPVRLGNQRAELEEHYLSYFCEGNNFVIYVMVVDRSQQSNYRIERYEVPFDGKDSLFKCGKCDAGFSTEKHKNYHERSRRFFDVLQLKDN